MKLCKDCIHSAHQGGTWSCRVSNQEKYCCIEKLYGECKGGKLFEPKPIAKYKIRAIIKGMQTKLKELFK